MTVGKALKSLISEVMRKKECYFLLLPFFILFLVFKIWPAINLFYYSFVKSTGAQYVFVMFANYVDVLGDSRFWLSLSNTVFFMALYTPLWIGISLLIAAMLNSKLLRFGDVFRTVVFLPVLLTLVAAAAIFQVILAQGGMFNSALKMIGLGPISWLIEPVPAKFSVLMVMLWKWSGYGAILLLAGMQSIPTIIFEQAEVDGANFIQKFFRITVPLLKPIIFFMMINSFIGVFLMYDIPVNLFYRVSPEDSALTVVWYIWREGFQFLRLEKAAAISVLLFLMLLAATIIQIWRLEKLFED